MLIKTKIHDKTIRASWNGNLSYVNGNKLTITYDVDVSRTPRHLANFMIGIILHKHFAWGNVPIEFEELTEKEVKGINDHIEVEHKRNWRDRATTATPIKVQAKTIADEKIETGDMVLCDNGMGRDGLTVINIAKELGFDMRSFTVGRSIEYTDTLWKERIATMKKFYKLKSIPSHIIETNYYHIADWAWGGISWWVFALPLAHHYGARAILSGLAITSSKTRIKNNLVYGLTESIFSFNYLTKATGISFSSPVRPLSQYGVQKLLVERYPETFKYQRSCMFGMPWCNKCGKCTKVSFWLSALGYDPHKIGLGTINEQKVSYQVIRKQVRPARTLINVYKKLNNQPYDKWIEQANQYVLDLLWNKKDVENILKEHFDIHPYDDIRDRFGYTVCPSKWSEWMNKGYINFCGVSE